MHVRSAKWSDADEALLTTLLAQQGKLSRREEGKKIALLDRRSLVNRRARLDHDQLPLPSLPHQRRQGPAHQKTVLPKSRRAPVPKKVVDVIAGLEQQAFNELSKSLLRERVGTRRAEAQIERDRLRRERELQAENRRQNAILEQTARLQEKQRYAELRDRQAERNREEIRQERIRRKLDDIRRAERAKHLKAIEDAAYLYFDSNDFVTLLDTDWRVPHFRAEQHLDALELFNGDGCRQLHLNDLDIDVERCWFRAAY